MEELKQELKQELACKMTIFAPDGKNSISIETVDDWNKLPVKLGVPGPKNNPPVHYRKGHRYRLLTFGATTYAIYHLHLFMVKQLEEMKLVVDPVNVVYMEKRILNEAGACIDKETSMFPLCILGAALPRCPQTPKPVEPPISN